MSWTCAKCKTTFEEQSGDDVGYCKVCGAPVEAIATDEEQTQRLDSRLRLVMLVFGVVWLGLFFIPFGTRSDYSPVWSWDLLRNYEGMAYLVAWPLVVAIILVVLAVTSPLPRWLRHGGGLLLSFSTLGVLFGSDPGGPFGLDLEFLFAGGACWILMFFSVGTALLLLSRYQDILGAKLFLGFGLLLGIIAYFSPAMDEATMVGALLYQLGQDDAAHNITRVLMLLPLFALLGACVGFGTTGGDSRTVARWSKVLGLGFLIFAPAVMVLFGLLMSSAQDSIWFFVLFIKMAAYASGLFTVGNIAAGYLVQHAMANGHPGFTK